MLAMLFGCGFRRSELVGLELDDIQMRQGHWAVVDLVGKGGHIRTVPIPNRVKAALESFRIVNFLWRWQLQPRPTLLPIYRQKSSSAMTGCN